MGSEFIYNHNLHIRLSVPNSYKWEAAVPFVYWHAFFGPFTDSSNITCLSLSSRCKMRLDSDTGPASSDDEPAPWTLNPGTVTARRNDDPRRRNIRAGRRAAAARSPELQARSPNPCKNYSFKCAIYRRTNAITFQKSVWSWHIMPKKKYGKVHQTFIQKL